MPTEPFRAADAHFQECRHIASFIDEQVRPRVDAAVERQADLALYQGLMLRVISWLRSLGKLNHPADFQAAMAGSRALFELAMDLVLLDAGGDAARERLESWEQSAKLRAGELARDFYGGAIDERGNTSPLVEYVERERARIVQRRTQLWGNHRHPPRWTGQSVGNDAAAADAHLPRGFRRYYHLAYTQHCWGTHGSTIVGIRDLDEVVFPALAMGAYAEAAKFALVAAEGTLRCTELWGPTMEKLFEDHRQYRLVEKYITMYLPHARRADEA